MPDWLKKKRCPNREKFLAGKRIMPKNITGREKLADLIDFRRLRELIPVGSHTAVLETFEAGHRFAKFYGFSETGESQQHEGKTYLIYRRD